MLYLILILFSGCATQLPDTLNHLKSDITHKKNFGSSSVGVDNSGNIVVRKEEDLDHVLRTLIWHNEELEENVKSEVFKIEDCRIMLNDPRLGGGEFTVNLPELEDFDSYKWKDEIIHINQKGELKRVKQDLYTNKLSQEKNKNNTLKKTVKLLAKLRSKCEQQVGYARVKYGLPAKKYRASGYFDHKGDWIEIHKAEKNLDDAFKIRALKKKKDKKHF